jgi:hypothetical protein
MEPVMSQAMRDVGVRAWGAATFVLAMIPLLPAAAMAQDARVCLESIYSQDLHIEVTDVRDIGQGFVQQLSTGSRPTSGSERIAYEHCASGQAISAVMSTWDENGRPVLPNPQDIMMSAMGSTATFSMADVVAQMTAAGVDARLMTLTRETCGCAVFYPEARGDKTPWVAP